MTNIQSKSNWVIRLAFGVFALPLTIPFCEKIIRKKYPQFLQGWDKLPLSSQNARKRFWVVIIITLCSFWVIARFEYHLKSQIQTQNSLEQQQNQADTECPVSFSPTNIYCLIIKSELLQLAETFSIVIAAWIFLLDRRERREQSYREDWSLIDGAKNSETSGARYSAITRLHQEKVSLKGLDAEGADLQGINLEGANLERSNLQRVDLQEAILNYINLEKANLQNANLKNARLQNAKLVEADLRGANLKEANLKNCNLGAAKLHRAVLKKANLEGAKLYGARFYYVDFQGVILDNTNIAQAEFIKPTHLTLEQVQKAKNWEKAKFDDEWEKNNPNIRRKPKANRASDGDKANELLNKLRELDEIENLIDEINSKRSMSVEDLNKYLNKHEYEFPEIEKLRQAIIALENRQDSIQSELEELLENIDNTSEQIKEESNNSIQ
ncbi:MAG: pentapeptide repeat-containing protein [Cyanobacteria bacterium P01_A01_bin.68]